MEVSADFESFPPPAVSVSNGSLPSMPVRSIPSPPSNEINPIPQPQFQNTTPPPPTTTIIAAKATPPPAFKSEDHKPNIAQREPREKKDSWKKKEAKESTRKEPVAPPQTTLLPFRLRPPPYRQEDINAAPRLPTFTLAYSTFTTDGRQVEFYRVSDQPFNKKKFRYTPCAAAPEFPQIMYKQIFLEPYYARINWQDMNPYVLIDKEALAVTTEKGYRMARTNVCVREGDWYIEFKIERGGGDQGGHTRVGFARRESTLLSIYESADISTIGRSCGI
jgi:hypothetical protein